MAKKEVAYTSDELQFEDEALAADSLQFSDAVADTDSSGVAERMAERQGPVGIIGEALGTIAKGPGQIAELATSDTPLPVVGGALGALKTGIDKSSEEAAKYYSELGVPRIGKAAEMGGKFVSGAIPATMKDALFILAAGPALKLVGMAGRPVVRAGGNMIADIAAGIAGKSPEALKVMFKKPGAIWSKATELFGQEHQKKLVETIMQDKAARGAQFKQLEEALTGFVAPSKATKVNASNVLQRTLYEMKRRGHYIPESFTGKKPIAVGRFPEDSAEARAIFEKLQILKDNPNMDFGQALNLRRQLDDMIDYGVQGSQGLQKISGESDRLLKFARRELDAKMKMAVPYEIKSEWTAANRIYREAAKSYEQLMRNVVKGAPAETEAKLLKMLKEGRYDDELITASQGLGERTAKALDDLRDQIAAKEFRRWAGRGGIVGILPTSPRAVGMAAAGTGAATRAAGAAGGALTQYPKGSAAAFGGLNNLLNGEPQ